MGLPRKTPCAHQRRIRGKVAVWPSADDTTRRLWAVPEALDNRRRQSTDRLVRARRSAVLRTETVPTPRDGAKRTRELVSNASAIRIVCLVLPVTTIAVHSPSAAEATLIVPAPIGHSATLRGVFAFVVRPRQTAQWRTSASKTAARRSLGAQATWTVPWVLPVSRPLGAAPSAMSRRVVLG